MHLVYCIVHLSRVVRSFSESFPGEVRKYVEEEEGREVCSEMCQALVVLSFFLFHPLFYGTTHCMFL